MTYSATNPIEPVPYRYDGGVSGFGLILMLGAAPAAGALVGGIAGWIRTLIDLHVGFSKWVVVVFIGFLIVGVAGISLGVSHYGKCRSRLCAFMGGLLTGCLTVVALHYAEYAVFQNRLGSIDPEVKRVARNFTQLRATYMEQTEATKKLIDDLARDTPLREVAVVDSFWKHFQFKAQKGIRLISKGGNTWNLGTTGSFVFWGIEAVLIVAAGAAVLVLIAGEPFCSVCQSWKSARNVGSFNATTDAVRDALLAGDFAKLATCQPTATGLLLLHLYHCPVCGDAAEMDAKLIECSKDEKGEVVSAKTVCFLTFPSEAAEAFRTLFPPLETTAHA